MVLGPHPRNEALGMNKQRPRLGAAAQQAHRAEAARREYHTERPGAWGVGRLPEHAWRECPLNMPPVEPEVGARYEFTRPEVSVSGDLMNSGITLNSL